MEVTPQWCRERGWYGDEFCFANRDADDDGLRLVIKFWEWQAGDGRKRMFLQEIMTRQYQSFAVESVRLPWLDGDQLEAILSVLGLVVPGMQPKPETPPERVPEPAIAIPAVLIQGCSPGEEPWTL